MSGSFKDGLHHINYRVYYEDTDAGGVMYHTNYMKFAERARTEILRACGYSQSDLMEEGFGIVVRKCSIDFLAPAKLDDLLTIETSLHDIGKASMQMHQTIRKGETDLATLQVKLASVKDFKPTRVPEAIEQAMRQKFKTST